MCFFFPVRVQLAFHYSLFFPLTTITVPSLAWNSSFLPPWKRSNPPPLCILEEIETNSLFLTFPSMDSYHCSFLMLALYVFASEKENQPSVFLYSWRYLNFLSILHFSFPWLLSSFHSLPLLVFVPERDPTTGILIFLKRLKVAFHSCIFIPCHHYSLLILVLRVFESERENQLLRLFRHS